MKLDPVLSARSRGVACPARSPSGTTPAFAAAPRTHAPLCRTSPAAAATPYEKARLELRIKLGNKPWRMHSERRLIVKIPLHASHFRSYSASILATIHWCITSTRSSTSALGWLVHLYFRSVGGRFGKNALSKNTIESDQPRYAHRKKSLKLSLLKSSLSTMLSRERRKGLQFGVCSGFLTLQTPALRE